LVPSFSLLLPNAFSLVLVLEPNPNSSRVDRAFPISRPQSTLTEKRVELSAKIIASYPDRVPVRSPSRSLSLALWRVLVFLARANATDLTDVRSLALSFR